MVDAVWLLPPDLQPWADIVIHSATKYLAGHLDVIAGLIAVREEALGDRSSSFKTRAGAFWGLGIVGLPLEE